MKLVYITHLSAAAFGAALVVSLNSWAIGGDAETMLMQLKSGDYEGMRNYLEIRADDYANRDRRLQERLEDIEKRLTDLSQRKTFTAPFTVLNEKGKPLLQVVAEKDGGVLKMLANDGAITSAAMSAQAAGGTVLVNNGAGKPTAGMASLAAGGKFIVTGPDGGNTIASMGVKDNAGQVAIYIPGGKELVAMSGAGNEGSLKTFSRAGYATAKLLSNGDGGSGYFELASGSDGQILVEAGETKNHAGTLKVGPVSRGPAAVMGSMGMAMASELSGATH